MEIIQLLKPETLFCFNEDSMGESKTTNPLSTNLLKSHPQHI